MDELVDELSSAMIDVDHQINSTSNECNVDIDVNPIDGFDGFVGERDAQMRSVKNHKPVARSASILIRSKLLILSDSESDDESNSGINSKMSQLSARKGKRGNKKQTLLDKSLCPKESSVRLQMALHSTAYTGKRKRSSTISEANQSSNPNLNGIQMDCDDNDMTETSSLSESSDEYNSDMNFDGDDEQSDWYEVIAKSNKSNQRQRHHNHSHSARPIDFAVPSARNPFLTMGLSSASSSSYSSSLSSANMLWKRRRRMH